MSFKFNSFGSSLRRSPAGAIKNNQNGFRKAKISKYFNFERIQKGPRRTQKAKRRNEFTNNRFTIRLNLFDRRIPKKDRLISKKIVGQ